MCERERKIFFFQILMKRSGSTKSDEWCAFGVIWLADVWLTGSLQREMADNKHICQELMSKIIAGTGLNHACSWRLTPLHLLRTGNSFWNMSRFQEPTCKPAQEGLLLPEPNRVMLVENISPTNLPKCLKSLLLGNSLPWSLGKLLLKSELVFWELTHSYPLWNKQQDFFFSFIFISWRLITLQYCSGFCHTLTWISPGFTCIPHPDPPSHLPLYPTPLGLPSRTLCCMLSRFSCVRLFVTLWTAACQAPLSMAFSKQEYWSGLPCPPPGESS